jgi:hypothetical protein
MTLEHFLQGAAIYAVISIIAVAWIMRIGGSVKKDDDDFGGMA